MIAILTVKNINWLTESFLTILP